MRNTKEWQQEFFGQKPIYATMSDGDYNNFYESEEAAKFEVDFWKKRHREIKVTPVYLHTLDLSRRRWGDDEREKS